jgi:HD-GYP domain-containing protein (c-di-GMP phosphodiesterase class II)
MTAVDEWIRVLAAHPRLQGVEVTARHDGVEAHRGGHRVLVVPCEALAEGSEAAQAFLTGGDGLVVVGDAPVALATLARELPLALVSKEASADALAVAVEGVIERAELRRSAAERTRQLTRYRYERGELVEIARALTQERDIDKLLGVILEKSRYITGADAGSIYVVKGEGPSRFLDFKLSQNDSLSFESSEFEIPVSTQSIAGAAVVTRSPISIADVYEIGDEVPYKFDRSFDQRVGYRSVSMLTMPMISAEDEVIGVIQLINKKRRPQNTLKSPADFRDQVVPFDAVSEELLASLAAQAGIALENALLYEEIRTIFEGFVRASVEAIEQRDPTTSGHSLRVSVLSCGLAEQVDRLDTGPFRDARFSRLDLQELQYAALLHDFGKIGVREEVLVKAKKLYPHEREAVRARLDFALEAAEAEALRRKLELRSDPDAESRLAAIDAALVKRQAELEDAWQVIERANEPTVLSEGDFSRIVEIGRMRYLDRRGIEQRFLSDNEVISLEVKRGSLSPTEMKEIQSHVVHTYDFLIRIPWGKTMRRIPDIAGAHHEKLNGSGYPHAIGAGAIPLASKIMTVADIYDALTARDRPYKKALPMERAFDILGFEVKDGNLDAELVRIFREAEIYRLSERELHSLRPAS